METETVEKTDVQKSSHGAPTIETGVPVQLAVGFMKIQTQVEFGGDAGGGGGTGGGGAGGGTGTVQLAELTKIPSGRGRP
jgi:hypothetical protein